MPSWVQVVATIAVVVGVIVSVVVALANRGIRQERIEQLEGRMRVQGDELADVREQIDRERTDCDRKLSALSERVSEQQGEISTLAGDLGRELGNHIGREIAQIILSELRQERRT